MGRCDTPKRFAGRRPPRSRPGNASTALVEFSQKSPAGRSCPLRIRLLPAGQIEVKKSTEQFHVVSEMLPNDLSQRRITLRRVVGTAGQGAVPATALLSHLPGSLAHQIVSYGEEKVVGFSFTD